MIAVIVPGLPEILEPFLQPNSEPFALALPADKMTEDEQQHFPQYAKYMLAFIRLWWDILLVNVNYMLSPVRPSVCCL